MKGDMDMTDKVNSLLQFCNIFSQTQPYPLHVLYKNELLQTFPENDLIPLLTDYAFNLQQTDQIFLHHAADLLLFGGVWNEDRSILVLLGPTLNMPLQEEALHGIIKSFNLSIEQRPQLYNLFRDNSGISLYHFRLILQELCFFLNGTLPETIGNIYPYNQDMKRQINSRSIDAVTSSNDQLACMRAYEFEQQLLNKIRMGSTDALRSIANAPDTHQGNLEFYSARYVKDMFICTVTLITRAAIEGGLDHGTAYQLSDFYIQTVENITTTKEVYELMDTMHLDYAQRVSRAKFDAEVPNDLYAILQFIRQGTYTSLKVSDVAAYAHMSVSQLERRFKTTLNFLPGDFILRCKMEEAKNLLKHTNKSISEISQILAFSSQAYFTNVFKKNYGCTPKSFRES